MEEMREHPNFGGTERSRREGNSRAMTQRHLFVIILLINHLIREQRGGMEGGRGRKRVPFLTALPPRGNFLPAVEQQVDFLL